MSNSLDSKKAESKPPSPTKSLKARLPSITIGRLLIRLEPSELIAPTLKICAKVCVEKLSLRESSRKNAKISRIKECVECSPNTTIKSPKENTTIPKGEALRQGRISILLYARIRLRKAHKSVKEESGREKAFAIKIPHKSKKSRAKQIIITLCCGVVLDSIV